MLRYKLHLKDAAEADARGAIDEQFGHFAAALCDRQNLRDLVIPLSAPDRRTESPGEAVESDALRHLCLRLLLAPSPDLLFDCVTTLFAQFWIDEISILCRLFPAETDAVLLTIDRRVADPAMRDTIRLYMDRGVSREQAEARVQSVLQDIDQKISRDPGNLALLVQKTCIFIANKRYDIALDALLMLASKIDRVDVENHTHRFAFQNLMFLMKNANTPIVKKFYDVFVGDRLAETVMTLPTLQLLLNEYGVDHYERFFAAYESATDTPVPLTKLLRMVQQCDVEPAVTLGAPPRGRRLIYANIVCWGRVYVDLMNDGCFRSLLAKGNIPALAQTNDLVIEIITMPEDVEMIKQLSAVNELAKICCIKIFSFPIESQIAMQSEKARAQFYPYYNFNFGFHFTRERARRHGADLLHFYPDVLYSDQMMTRVATYVGADPVAVLFEAQNARATPLLQEVAQRFRAIDGSYEIPARAMSSMTVRYLMPRAKMKIFEPGATSFPKFMMSFIFGEEGGYSTRMLHLNILYASHAAFAPVTKVNYSFPDNEHTFDVLNRLSDDQIITFSEPDDPLGVEISDSDGSVHPLVHQDPLDLLKSNFFERFIGLSSVRLFKRERFYHCEPGELDCVIDPVEKAKFIESVVEMMENDPFFTKFLPMRDVGWVFPA